MAGAAEADALGDLLHRECGLPDEQSSRGIHASAQHIGVWRQLQALSEGALKVARAHAGEPGQFAQRNRPGEIRLYVIDDGVETTPQSARIARHRL